MRAIVEVVTAAAILAASAAVSHAASSTFRCDTVKIGAVARLFKDVIQCNHKGQFDLSFDLGSCRTVAYDKCTKAIMRADASFGTACFYTANFNVCTDALNSANSIYPNV